MTPKGLIDTELICLHGSTGFDESLCCLQGLTAHFDWISPRSGISSSGGGCALDGSGHRRASAGASVRPPERPGARGKEQMLWLQIDLGSNPGSGIYPPCDGGKSCTSGTRFLFWKTRRGMAAHGTGVITA